MSAVTKCFFLEDTGRTRHVDLGHISPGASREEPIYKRSDAGEETTLYDAPPGAMWFADWLLPFEKPGSDGHVLVVRLPNGREWVVDGRCSNCTMPKDNVHKCWVRHGTPPLVTVDKNGHTCAAGAGSILSGDWHGFLQNGELRQC